MMCVDGGRVANFMLITLFCSILLSYLVGPLCAAVNYHVIPNTNTDK
jgi:hypothetical protein